MVMFPKTVKPITGWPVVVWAHGTTGVGDDCAPSKNEIGTNFGKLANSLLAAGYVIVAPDYEGLGVPGIHPYLNLGSEAKSAIHAVKAAQQGYANQISKSWMSVGQSQGGHASLGIAEYSNFDPNFKGAVAAAPASSLGYIITQIAPSAITAIENYSQKDAVDIYSELLSYAAYTGVGIKAYETRFNLSTIFKAQSQVIAEKAEGTTGDNGLCLSPLMKEFSDDINKFLSLNSNYKVMDYPGLQKDFEKNTVVSKFLSDNQPGTKAFRKPVYVVQGKLDTTVPYQVTELMVKNLNTIGSNPPVVLDIVENASHTEAIVQKNQEIVDFIKSYLPPR
jgi:dienelactone hydrolase